MSDGGLMRFDGDGPLLAPDWRARAEAAERALAAVRAVLDALDAECVSACHVPLWCAFVDSWGTEAASGARDALDHAAAKVRATLAGASHHDGAPVVVAAVALVAAQDAYDATADYLSNDHPPGANDAYMSALLAVQRARIALRNVVAAMRTS